MALIIKGTVVGRHVDSGIEYVRIQGDGQELTALVPASWVIEENAQTTTRTAGEEGVDADSGR